MITSRASSHMDLSFGRIHFELEISNSDDPSRLVLVYHGKIFATGNLTDEIDDDFEEVEVGRMTVYIIDLDRAINDGESLFDVMDCLNSETFDLYEALFTKSGPRKAVMKCLDENRLFLPYIMLIGSLSLDTQFRGQEIGAEVACAVINSLGSGCQIIACKPFPLQYEHYKAEDRTPERRKPTFEIERKAAWRKVRSFWTTVGFVRVPNTQYYLWPK